MLVEIITKEDLRVFKRDLLKDFSEIIKSQPKPTKWLKSKEVRKLLNISPGTLQTLRNNQTIPYSKIGGVIYYSETEIHKVLQAKNRSI